MNAVQDASTTAVSQGFFKGIAVVIDDGINQANAGTPDGILTILKAIEDAGGHAVTLTALPKDSDELDGFSNAAFFIMDWNLQGAAILGSDISAPVGLGLDLGSLRSSYEEQNVVFLKKLRERRHAPVFIMTNESVVHVTQYLIDNGVMGDDNGAHIMIKSKSEVGSNLYQVLNDWLEQTPSARVLKEWEQNQTQAINLLFNEFHDRNKYWPVILWSAYKADEVSPQVEINDLITRLVAARMRRLSVNLDGFEAQAHEHYGTKTAEYRQSLHAVLESERFLPDAVLDPEEYAPGDLFLDPNNGTPRLLLNVRPICDCVQRSGSDSIMYMIRGKVLTDEKLEEVVDPRNGNIREKDNETIIFALYEGKTISFGYREVLHGKFKGDSRLRRLGRVLPPFLTKITQRYAAYSHRPGLPRIPSVLIPPKVEATTVPPIDTAPAANGTSMDS